jgi:hypothetical protein
MNKGATVVFTPSRLVPVLILDQPRTGTHCFAPDCIAGTLMDVRVIRLFAAKSGRRNDSQAFQLAAIRR